MPRPPTPPPQTPAILCLRRNLDTSLPAYLSEMLASLALEVECVDVAPLTEKAVRRRCSPCGTPSPRWLSSTSRARARQRERLVSRAIRCARDAPDWQPSDTDPDRWIDVVAEGRRVRQPRLCDGGGGGGGRGGGARAPRPRRRQHGDAVGVRGGRGGGGGARLPARGGAPAPTPVPCVPSPSTTAPTACGPTCPSTTPPSPILPCVAVTAASSSASHPPRRT